MIPVPCVFYLRPVAALKHLFVSFLSCIKNLLLICMEGCSMGSRWGIRLQALCSWCEYLLPLVNKSGQVCSVCSRHQNHPIIFSFCIILYSPRNLSTGSSFLPQNLLSLIPPLSSPSNSATANFERCAENHMLQSMKSVTWWA